MKIGILSDTHSKTKNAQEIVDYFLDQNVEFIIHAGDIVEIEILELLKNSKVRYVAVYGNNDAHLSSYHDSYNLVQEPHYFKLAQTTFKLMHLPFFMTPDTEVVLFGHTHQFEIEFTQNGTLFLNPGESCARNKPLMECSILEVTKEDFKVTYCFKKPKENRFETKKYSFQRKI